MRKNNRKGFTLAELLIVVAIIAVLVAIAVPVFTTQLERSREATDLANIRSAYAEAMAEYLAKGASSGATASGALKQTSDGWDTSAVLTTRVNGSESTITLPSFAAATHKNFTVNVAANGSVTVSFS